MAHRSRQAKRTNFVAFNGLRGEIIKSGVAFGDYTCLIVTLADQTELVVKLPNSMPLVDARLENIKPGKDEGKILRTWRRVNRSASLD